MPLHQKLTIVTRPIKPATSSSPEQSDAKTVNTVSIDINPQTVVTIFGIAAAACTQDVTVELFEIIDNKEVSNGIVEFGGKGESLEIQKDDGPTTLNWGPFTNARTVVLKFYHNYNKGSGYEVSAVREDKMKEYVDDTLKTAVSLIPASNEEKDTDVHVVINVSRMTLL